MRRRGAPSRDLAVLQAALVCEGILLVTAFIFSALFDIPLIAAFSFEQVVVGLLVGVPLLLGNILFSRYASFHPERFPTFTKFTRELIEPLCQELPLPAAFVVAALSGLCEELFFRGILQLYLTDSLGLTAAIILTNILFATIHFLGRIKEFLTLLPFYFFCGVYFSFIAHVTSDLTAVIVAHGLNNFIAVCYVRRRLRKNSANYKGSRLIN